MSIYINLDNDDSLHIVPIGGHYQVMRYSDGKTPEPVGIKHETFLGAFDEFRHVELSSKEQCTLEEIKNSILSTNAKILEFFELNSEHLATL